MLHYIFLSFIFISLSSGEINRYNRKIEFGVEAEGGFSNNYIKATDILVKDLVIDIAKLADDLYGKDFVMQNVKYFENDEKNCIKVDKIFFSS